MSARMATGPTEASRSPELTIIRDLGRLLDDLEKLRIQSGNRIAAAEREHGGRFPAWDVIQPHLAAAEHEAELELVRVWRRHPLAPWAKSYLGLGEKSIARLISIIDDPAERPNVAKLWAYCGHGDPARISLRKGMTQEELLARGNPWAKKQVRLIAMSIEKQRCAACTRSERERREEPNKPARWAPPPADCTCAEEGFHGRILYDAAREKYADAVHAHACARCGPSGSPALPGSALSDGHKHARALRALGKVFLRDLWIAARHSATVAQSTHASGSSASRHRRSDAHTELAGGE